MENFLDYPLPSGIFNRWVNMSSYYICDIDIFPHFTHKEIEGCYILKVIQLIDGFRI